MSEAEPRRIETPDALCSLSVEAPEEGLPVFFQLQILLPNTNTVNNGDPHLYLQVTAICSTQSFPWRLSSATAAVVAIFGVFALEPARGAARPSSHHRRGGNQAGEADIG